MISSDLPAAQFELFDDVGDLLEAVGIPMRPPFRVRDDQEGGPLKEEHLVGVDNVGKVGQRALQLLHIGDEHVDDGGPCLKKKENIVSMFIAKSSWKVDRLTLYRVSSQMDVRKQVQSSGLDSRWRFSSRSRNICWEMKKRQTFMT